MSIRASFGLHPEKLSIPFQSDAMLLELPTALKFQQRLFELRDIVASPKDHVPKNHRLGESRNPALPRAPQGNQTHAEIISNCLLWDKVLGKLHRTLGIAPSYIFANHPQPRCGFHTFHPKRANGALPPRSPASSHRW
jgi:hypothetical protein